MKLSTMIVAAASLIGVAVTTTQASAAVVSVYNGYEYTYGDDAYSLVVTPIALADLTINGSDYGPVAAGSSTYFWFGDPEYGPFSYTVSITYGGKTTSGSYLNYADLDYTRGPDLAGTLTAAPEPATWALMLAGLAGLGFVGHRRKAAKLA